MSDKIGSFKFEKGNKKVLTNIKKSKRGKSESLFGFAIGIDNSKLVLEDSYLMNSENYVTSDNYELSVSKSEDDQYTHKIHLITKRPKNEDVTISLKRNTPLWITETHSADDSKMTGEQLNKTYGFKQFVEGIERAYDTALRRQDSNGTENFYSINVKIKN